jgi:putative aminopeptidase FrvX
LPLPPVDMQFLLEFLTGLLNTPSPTGYAHRAIAFTREALAPFPELKLALTRKGALLATWPGSAANAPRALTAHVDTLGAMVKEIKPNGRLKLTRIGGFILNTIEGEGCKVFTRDGQVIRGSYLLNKASSHVHGKEVSDLERNEENLEMRLDTRTESAVETYALGIEVGDFVAFDPRVEITNGFVRSRHLDDKACVACLLATIKAFHTAGLKPAQTTYLHFSNFEEVGHGAAAGIPADVAELVVLDMAAIGDGQASDEFHATLCVKDSSGPYHHDLGLRLRQLADDQHIPYRVDIYPYYGSDGSAYWRAGGEVAVALIGPGVDASHNYERTHSEALLATTQWIMAYLLAE